MQNEALVLDMGEYVNASTGKEALAHGLMISSGVMDACSDFMSPAAVKVRCWSPHCILLISYGTPLELNSKQA